MGKTGAGAAIGKREMGGHARGIFLIIFAVAGFSCMDASAKWLNLREHAFQTVAVRYIGSFVVTACFLNPYTRPGILRSSRPLLQVLRGLFVFSSSVCVFTALKTLPLTVLTSITFAAPLLVALLAGPILGEKLGPRRAAAIVVGFIGVLVITRPGTESFHAGMWLALGAALSNTGYFLITRVLSRHDAPETTHLFTGIVGALASVPLTFTVWQTPTALDTWLVIGFISFAGAASHWQLILAHKHAPATVLSPFFYTQLLFAALVGWVVFRNVPDRWTILGGGIVIVSGLYLLYRERVRHHPPSVDVAV